MSWVWKRVWNPCACLLCDWWLIENTMPEFLYIQHYPTIHVMTSSSVFIPVSLNETHTKEILWKSLLCIIWFFYVHITMILCLVGNIKFLLIDWKAFYIKRNFHLYLRLENLLLFGYILYLIKVLFDLPCYVFIDVAFFNENVFLHVLNIFKCI